MKLFRQLVLVAIGLLCVSMAFAAHQGSTNHKRRSSFQSSQMSQMTIAQIANRSSKLSVLASALRKTGLDRELNSSGPFTVFAPTNRAFRKLPGGTLQKLMRDPRRLKALLQYHVVEGRYPSSKLRNGERLETLQGHDEYITTRRNRIYVNNARIVKANIMAKNGIVHLVNNVVSYQRRSR